MRRFALRFLAVITAVGLVLASGFVPANAQSAPGYWAGDISRWQSTVNPALSARPVASPAAVAAGVAPAQLPSGMAEPVPPTTNQTRQALNFYGGKSARATLSQMPRRTPIQPAASGPMPHHGKPFQSAATNPTISPYLNLFRDDEHDLESAPSYYAFVRPQLEQQETNQRQQRELERLERQSQRRPAAAIGPRYQTTGEPNTGSSARFMDTAQFYSGWRR